MSLPSTSTVAEQFLKLGVAPIAALSAFAFVLTSTRASAHTYYYCRQDVFVPHAPMRLRFFGAV
jgi:hypothetical protein